MTIVHDPTLFRLYDAAELRPDGYPQAWHDEIKHLVREDAGHRCARCLHPYERGTGEWSRCDEQCTHGGRVLIDGEEYSLDAGEAGVVAAAGQDVFAAWRILTVHHLDGVKANCRWWNLTALCQRCHLQIQAKVKMERVWIWEHSPWFRPFVAGYYAHAYLREDLSRDEAVARMDELLALERVA